jgi:transposase
VVVPAVQGREQPFLETRHVDSAEPGLCRRFRRRASAQRGAVCRTCAPDPARQARWPAAHDRHAAVAGRLVLPRANRLPMAPLAATPGLPTLADGIRVHAHVRERRRVGGDPPSSRGDAARAGGPRAEPERGRDRHPERKDDGKGGPRGWDAAKKVKGRKRHVAVDTSGLLLGILVHAVDIQDADGAGDLLRWLKRLYPWLKVVFADSAYDRLAALLACFLLGLTLVVIRRPAGTAGFVLLPRRWVAERTLGWLGRWRRLAREYEELPEVSETMVKLAMIRLMLHRLAHPNRKRLPAH